MNKRINISSETDWERKVGYSRVVKTGNQIFVAGTTAVDEKGNIIGIGDVYKQTEYVILKIEKFLNKAGATLENVVRTRMFVVNIEDWEEIAKAHNKFFKNIKPVATMIEVNGLINSDLLIEMEIDAIIT